MYNCREMYRSCIRAGCDADNTWTVAAVSKVPSHCLRLLANRCLLMDAFSVASTARHLSLNQLPDAFLRQLALVLPSHAKLQLRQCCHRLLEAVDATGIKLRLLASSSPTAWTLCRRHVCAIDITESPGASAVLLPPGSCLCLQELSCSLNQLGSLDAFEAAGCRLLRLKLSGQTPALPDSNETQQTPGNCLAGLTSLTSLQMNIACHKVFTARGVAPAQATERTPNSQQQLLWSLVAAQCNLQNLILQHSKQDSYSTTRCTISNQCWQDVIQPLTALTRLEMGTRGISSGSDSTVEADHPAPAPAAEIPHLRHLRCLGIDKDCADVWDLSWVADFTSLTYLDIFFCSAGEVDFDVLGQLKRLCTLSLHYYPDECITSDQLSPLSACTQLTCLRVDALVIEEGHRQAMQDSMLVAAAQRIHNASQAATASHQQGSVTSCTQTALPQLPTLLKLVAGVMCKAPVATLAPNLTQLRDLDYDLGELQLGMRFLDENPTAGKEALAGLKQLQLLAVNVFALVRHSAYSGLTQLSNLTDLHVEMVGNLTGTLLAAAGLPHLPHLTKLVMTLPISAKRNLGKTYTTEEDILIWKNQSSLRHMRLRGTMRLGGFLVHGDMLASMPARLPDLRCIELVKCGDLTVEHLRNLVHSKAARRVVVQGCKYISACDCMQLQESSMSVVRVDFEL